MALIPSDEPHLEDPCARLERALIDDYLVTHGYDPKTLWGRQDHDARRLMTEASTYAATRLTEVESRAHYIHDIHLARGS